MGTHIVSLDHQLCTHKVRELPLFCVWLYPSVSNRYMLQQLHVQGSQDYVDTFLVHWNSGLSVSALDNVKS